MIKAAIDIGTNSCRLLIADVDGEQKDLHREAQVTRLGKDVDRTKTIAPVSMKKTITVLKEYIKIASEHKAQNIFIGATSAARDAKNIEIFREKAKDETGLNINVLSSEQEAQLSFAGALGCLKKTTVEEPNIVVLDIGGGSTELSMGSTSEQKPVLSFSKDIGSVRLTELFIKNDPPLSEELEKAAAYISEAYQDEVSEIKARGSFRLIGTAGTVTTLAAINLQLRKYDADKVHCSKLSLEAVEKIFEMLKKLTTPERKNIEVIQPGRADVIVMGSLILKTLTKLLGTQDLIVSETDILDGLLTFY